MSKVDKRYFLAAMITIVISNFSFAFLAWPKLSEYNHLEIQTFEMLTFVVAFFIIGPIVASEMRNK